MPHATNFEEEQLDPLEVVIGSDNAIDQYSDSKNEQEDVESQLHYLAPSLEYSKSNPPIQVVTRAATYHDPRTTVKLSQGPLETIHDVRGREHEYTLEQNGFQFVKHQGQFSDWDCKEKIWTEYVEKELKELTSRVFGGVEGGVDEVIAFHEGKRGSNKEWRQAADGQRTNPFAKQVHVDQTAPTIRQIVHDKTDIKADWLCKGRIRQVNAWRPLYHPVYDCSLCVADAKTVIKKDCIEAHRIREKDGAFLDTMGVVKYRQGRKWCYKSRMEPDDVVFFMGYDSDCDRGKRDGPGFTLHSAFDIPNPPPGSPPRASIEVRLLVFTWPKEPLYIFPPLGMLTAQAPPRSAELYESHHTLNADVEEFPSPNNGRAASPPHFVTLPDHEGNPVEIDLNDYDPAEFPRPSRSYRSDSIISSTMELASSRRPSSSLALYEHEITEPQLITMANQRADDLQRQICELRRQLEGAEKTREMVKDPQCRRQMIGLLNERRRDELCKQRQELARRIRSSVDIIDL